MLVAWAGDYGYPLFEVDAANGQEGGTQGLFGFSMRSHPTATIHAAAATAGTVVSKFQRVAMQTADLTQYLDSDGTTLLPFHVLPSGYAAQALHTPASSTEACTAGQWVDDTGFHYVCTATNTWKRIVLTAF